MVTPSDLSKYERFLKYFDRDILAHYRAKCDQYRIIEHDLGGEVMPASTEETGEAIGTRPWFRVRFGYRRLRNGSVCIAAFLPDLKTVPDREAQRWGGAQLDSPDFEEDDPRFLAWVEASFEAHPAEPGPRVKLQREIELVSALTEVGLRVPLWSKSTHPLMNFPIAENTEAYSKAHLELYRVLIDSMSKNALEQLAARRGIRLSDPSKRMNSLTEVLPAALHDTVYAPLKRHYKQRQAVHGVSSKPPQPLDAFDRFSTDLEELHEAIRVLRCWLEDLLGLEASACKDRVNTMKHRFPKIEAPAPAHHFPLGSPDDAVGKTIERVEFGAVMPHPDLHLSDAMILHFTDGSAMAVRVSTNVGNLRLDFEGFEPNEVHTTLEVVWAPSGRRE